MHYGAKTAHLRRTTREKEPGQITRAIKTLLRMTTKTYFSFPFKVSQVGDANLFFVLARAQTVYFWNRTGRKCAALKTEESAAVTFGTVDTFGIQNIGSTDQRINVLFFVPHT